VDIKGENVGVNLQDLVKRTKSNPSRPDRGTLHFLGSGPPLLVPIRSARTEVPRWAKPTKNGSDPHSTVAAGSLHSHLYAAEVLGRTPSPTLPQDRVLHRVPRCVSLPLPKIELWLKAYPSNPLTPNAASTNPRRSARLWILHEPRGSSGARLLGMRDQGCCQGT
jgi:hypothetical protein